MEKFIKDNINVIYWAVMIMSIAPWGILGWQGLIVQLTGLALIWFAGNARIKYEQEKFDNAMRRTRERYNI